MSADRDYYVALQKFGDALGQPGHSEWAQESAIVAACCVYSTFEAILTEDQDPYIKAQSCLMFWTEYLHRIQEAETYYSLTWPDEKINENPTDIEEMQLKLYTYTWPVFAFREQTFDELKGIISKRLHANDLDRLFSGKNVIDLGCGGGRFSFVANEQGARRTLGIDFNENNIKAAKQLVVEQRLDDIEFRVSSLYNTDEPDAAYDVVIANGVFHHMLDPQAAYNESSRLLSEGGKLFLYVEAEGGIINELQEVTARNLGHITFDTVSTMLTRLSFSDHSHMNLIDHLFAYYEYVPSETIYGRLRKAGYSKIEELTGLGMSYERGHFHMSRDRWSQRKYGGGQLRLLATL